MILSVSRDDMALAVFHANQRYAARKPRINVQLSSICAQLRARTRNRRVQASIAVAKILAYLEDAGP